MCLIYNYMENKSLEHKLHNVTHTHNQEKKCTRVNICIASGCNVCVFVCQQSSCLSWSQRVSVVTGASTALQFLHCPPKGNAPLIHGDVKRSASHLVSSPDQLKLPCQAEAMGPFGSRTLQRSS